MLFVQGSRDDLADLALVDSLIARLGARATLALFDDADHAFHVRARSGSSDAEVLERILDTIVVWIGRVVGRVVVALRRGRATVVARGEAAVAARCGGASVRACRRGRASGPGRRCERGCGRRAWRRSTPRRRRR